MENKKIISIFVGIITVLVVALIITIINFRFMRKEV